MQKTPPGSGYYTTPTRATGMTLLVIAGAGLAFIAAGIGLVT